MPTARAVMYPRWCGIRAALDATGLGPAVPGLTVAWVALAALLGTGTAYGLERATSSRGHDARSAAPDGGAVAVGARRCAATASVALTTGLLWVLLEVRFGPGGTAAAEGIFVAGLLALARIDVRELRLPKVLVYATLLATAGALLVTSAVNDRWARFGLAAACGVGSFLVFLALHLVRPAWLGFGDVRLALPLGVGVGWIGPEALVVAFLVANVAAAAAGLVLIAAGRATRTTPLPYGLFLAVGAVVAVLAVPPVT